MMTKKPQSDLVYFLPNYFQYKSSTGKMENFNIFRNILANHIKTKVSAEWSVQKGHTRSHQNVNTAISVLPFKIILENFDDQEKRVF